MVRPTSFVVAGLIGLTVLVTWPLARQLNSAFPGDYGDPVFVAWVIGWVGGKLTEAITNPQPSAHSGTRISSTPSPRRLPSRSTSSGKR